MAWKFFTNTGAQKTSGVSGQELDYKEVTSSQTSTATTAATATAQITGNAVTYDGSTPVIIEFFAPNESGSSNPHTNVYELYDGSTDLGQIAVAAGPLTSTAIRGTRRLTPSAGSHTYSIRLWVGGGTGTTSAGVGGANTLFPMTLRITRAS